MTRRYEYSPGFGRHIEVEAAPVPEKPKPLKRKYWFVQMPTYWIEQLAQVERPSTFKLAHKILCQEFERRKFGGDIILSTEATGIARKTRPPAIRELVGLGLIEVDQRGRGAVVVTKLNLTPPSTH